MTFTRSGKMGVPKDLFEKNIKRLNQQNLHVIPLTYDTETPTLSWSSRGSRPRRLK